MPEVRESARSIRDNPLSFILMLEVSSISTASFDLTVRSEKVLISGSIRSKPNNRAAIPLKAARKILQALLKGG
jgi:hypothetical protein